MKRITLKPLISLFAVFMLLFGLMNILNSNALADEYSEGGFNEDFYGNIVVTSNYSNIETGTTGTLYCDVFTNVTAEGWTRVEWYSTNNDVISIYSTDNRNRVDFKANRSGSASIGAKLFIDDELYSEDSVSISVYDPAPRYIEVRGVVLNEDYVEIRKGSSQYIHAHVEPSDANNKDITFYSNNNNIAYVDSDGEVHAVNEGECNITAKSNENGYCDYCTIHVFDDAPKNLPVTGVSINPGALTLEIGKTYNLKANILPANTINTQVIWDASYPQIANVDQSGRVTAYSIGYSVINVTTVNNSKKASIIVTVVPAKTPAPKPANNNKPAGTNNSTHSAVLNFLTIQQIMATPKNGTALVEQEVPMSYDSNVAMILATRPDIKLACTFKLNGSKFKMTLPKGFDLAKALGPDGYVDWLALCTNKNVKLELVK